MTFLGLAAGLALVIALGYGVKGEAQPSLKDKLMKMAVRKAK